MKRMNEVFELPVASGERVYEADDIFQAGGNGVWCATFCSDEQAKSACSAINHIDALADALESLTSDYTSYKAINDIDLTDDHSFALEVKMNAAIAALAAYRGKP